MPLRIRKVEVPANKRKMKCPHPMKATRIVIHNTANDAPAKNEIAYMHRNDNYVSFHYAVDDKEAIQGLPLDRNGWHAGDGNGKGNREGIAIEICYSKSGGAKFIKAEQNAAILTAQLLHERGWGTEKVTKHQDYSGKYCPHRTLDMGWQRFLIVVQKELDKLDGVSEVSPHEFYRVQVGAYRNKQYADKMYNELKGQGYDVYMVNPTK